MMIHDLNTIEEIVGFYLVRHFLVWSVCLYLVILFVLVDFDCTLFGYVLSFSSIFRCFNRHSSVRSNRGRIGGLAEDDSKFKLLKKGKLRSHIFSQKDHNHPRVRLVRAKRQEETFFIKMDGPLSSSANNQRQARPFQDVTNQANGLQKEGYTTGIAPPPAVAWQLYHYPHLLLPRRDSNDQENWTSRMTYERSTSLLSVS
jgi:hypothetical protein